MRGAVATAVTPAATTDVIHVPLHEDAATTATTDEVRGAEAPADLGPRHVTAAVITAVIVAAIDPTAVTEAVVDQNLVTQDVLRDPAPLHRATVSAPPRLPFALGAAGTGATSFANAFWWLHTQETIRPRRAASAFAFGPTKSTPTSSRSPDTPPCVRGKRHPTWARRWLCQIRCLPGGSKTVLKNCNSARSMPSSGTTISLTTATSTGRTPFLAALCRRQRLQTCPRTRLLCCRAPGFSTAALLTTFKIRPN